MGMFVGYGFLAVAGLAGWYACRRRGARPPMAAYFPIIGVTGLLCLAVAAVEGMGGTGGSRVEALPRQEFGEQQITLYMEADGVAEKGAYQVTVEEQQLSEAQKQEFLDAAAEELERLLSGEGEEISADLTVPSTLQDGRVEAAVTFWPGQVIDAEGVIHWENFEEENPLIKVSSLLECQEAEMFYEFYLNLKRPPMSHEEMFYEGLREQLQEQNGKTGTDSFALPTQVSEVPVTWYQEEEQMHWKLLLLGGVVILAHYIAGRAKREKEQKERTEGLHRDYPDIVSRLSLLVGAGMTANAAIGKLALEYQRGRMEGRQAKRPGYEELLRTWNEIQDGAGERKAYENLGVRCNQTQYRKLSSLLIQNVRKGAKGMQQLLDAEVTETYLQRRAYVKQQGEEAAAKLLLPIGMMLILVFAILIIPAMLSLQL